MSDARAISEMSGAVGDRGAPSARRASAREFMLLEQILGVLASPLACPQALRALEQAAIETASGPIVVLDALGRMQRVKPLASRLSGYAPDELIGRPFWGAVPPAEVAAVRATLDALFADGATPSGRPPCGWAMGPGRPCRSRYADACSGRSS